MSNHYADTFVYAIDSKNQIHMLMDSYFASTGYGHKSEICINHKLYSVFTGVDDNGDMITEKNGSVLPFVGPSDCRSFFGGQPSAEITQAIKEAELHKLNIVKFVCLDFKRFGSLICWAEGWEITPNNETRVDVSILEKAITNNKDVELVADYVIRQLTEDDINDNKGE